MSVDKSRLIIEDALCVHCSVHSLRVHHSEFPEIRAECGSVAEAVAHLIGELTCARDYIQSHWHRELIDRAIADATEFLNVQTGAGQGDEASCQCPPHVPDQIEPRLPGDITAL